MISVETRDGRVSGVHQKIAWLFLAALLFLRLPFLGGIRFVVPVSADWADPVFQIGTYLLTAVLIWWERDRLSQFHIDGLAIGIIILFKPLQTLIPASLGEQKLPLAFPNWPSFIRWAGDLWLSVTLVFSRTPLPRVSSRSFGWLLLGLLAGVGLSIVLAYPMSFQVDPRQAARTIPWLEVPGLVAWSVPYQLGYAAISEEPIFRGFLWGYLRQAGWKDVWIWLFQALLFTLAHIYYVNTVPISFWILVPAAALIFGLLAWRSRLIVTSMSAHAVTNALGYTAGLVVASLRL